MTDIVKDKEKLMKVKNSIRKKFRDLHNQQIELDDKLHEQFKPIIDPLHKIRDIVSKPTRTQLNEVPTNFGTVERHVDQAQFSDNFRTAKTKILQPKRLFTTVSGVQTNNRKIKPIHKSKAAVGTENDSFENNFSNLSNSDEEINQRNESMLKSKSSKRKSIEYDRYQTRALNNPTYFSVYPLDNKLYIGNDEITIHDDFIIVKNKKYIRTLGLIELLMMSNPKIYTKDDLKVYKSIIIDTNCHKLNFQANQRIVRNMTDKYKLVIQNLFPIHKGGSIDQQKFKNELVQTQFMIADKRKNTYTYWDNPNELVERLRLLISSRSAGHTGHTNEIISIIEELKEAKIIK